MGVSDHTPDEIATSAALLKRASSPATADELEAADATISRFIEVVLEPSETAPTRRRRALPVPTRVAAVVVAATLWSTGIAAAATGHLPDQVQHAVSNTASHVGLSLPDPSDERAVETSDEQSRGDRSINTNESDSSTSSIVTSTTSPTSTSPTSTSPTTTATPTDGSVAAASASLSGGASRGVGPDVNGPAHDGLCNAYLRGLATGHPKNPDAPPWRDLLSGAKQAGKSVEAFCGSTTATTTATTVASAATTASKSSTSSSTATTDETSTTIQAEGNPHGGGNGSSDAGNGDGSSQGNRNGNSQGNSQGNRDGNGNSQGG